MRNRDMQPMHEWEAGAHEWEGSAYMNYADQQPWRGSVSGSPYEILALGYKNMSCCLRRVPVACWWF